METDRAGGVARADLSADSQVAAAAAQSRLPSTQDRVGNVVAMYDFDAHGGAVSTPINLGVSLPDNSIVVGYTLQAVGALTGVGADIDLGFSDFAGNGTGDEVLDGSAITALDVDDDVVSTRTGVPNLVTLVDDADGNPQPQYLTMTINTAALTAGTLLIVLDVVQGN